MTDSQIRTGSRSERDLPSGLALAAAAPLSVAIMSRHPTISAHEPAARLAEAAAEADASRLVHGSIIALSVVLVTGFLGFAHRFGARRPNVRSGLLCYIAGSLAFAGAAVLDGFVAPGLAARFASADAAEVNAVLPVIASNTQLNRALALQGMLAFAAAAMLWSSTLLRQPGVWRWLGIAGLLLGGWAVTTCVTQGFTFPRSRFRTFVLLYLAWTCGLGIAMAVSPRQRRLA
ncbi:MAG: hypothetical protein AAF628_19235 [Planctomycetota bacterium]